MALDSHSQYSPCRVMCALYDRLSYLRLIFVAAEAASLVSGIHPKDLLPLNIPRCKTIRINVSTPTTTRA
jgi:hypothetical protein